VARADRLSRFCVRHFSKIFEWRDEGCGEGIWKEEGARGGARGYGRRRG
jgi:hypothetical protein